MEKNERLNIDENEEVEYSGRSKGERIVDRLVLYTCMYFLGRAIAHFLFMWTR